MDSSIHPRMTALERAFQLAKLGRVAALSELLAILKSEGHALSQIDGPALKRQLREHIRAARPENPDSQS
jgi:hypothetical protein